MISERRKLRKVAADEPSEDFLQQLLALAKVVLLENADWLRIVKRSAAVLPNFDRSPHGYLSV